MKKFSYNEPVPKVGGALEANQIEYLESKVRFSLRHCSTKRDSCISGVTGDKQLLQAVYDRFGHLEQMTWQQAKSVDHRKGLSIESKTGTNHKDLAKEFPGFETYCHMRVNHQSKSKFRIFGTIQQDCFCVLKFDVDGKINH